MPIQSTRVRGTTSLSGYRRWAVPLKPAGFVVVSAVLVMSGSGAAVASASAAVSVRRAATVRSVVSRSAASVFDSGVVSRPDAVSAQVTARATGKRVEDLSQETSTTQVFANPDGSWSSESYDSPVRLKDRASVWHDIDTTLVVRDGRVAPKRAVSDMSFSDGGDEALVDFTEDGKDLGLRWTSDLPKPTLSGDMATYADVEPGVDLTVRALGTGFEDSLVLKSRPAGQVSFSTPIVNDGAKVTATDAGGVVVGPATDPLVTATPPVVYDATGQVSWVGSDEPGTSAPANSSVMSSASPAPSPEASSAGGPAVGVATTTVGTTAAGATEMTIVPGQAFLADPSTVYPVTIDPTFTMTPTMDTWVENMDFTTGQGGSDELRAGSWDTGTHIARSFIKFDSSRWIGTHVISAKMLLRNFYSKACNSNYIHAKRLTAGWTVGALTWANQPDATTVGEASFFPAYGATGCDPADAIFVLTPIVQYWANGGANYGLKIRADNESGEYSWRRYRSANYSDAAVRPRLQVSYNSYPNVPTTPQVTPVASYTPPGSSSSSLYTSDATPVVSSTVKDPDGGTVRVHVEAYASKAGSAVSSCDGAYVASGGVSSCSLGTTLADGTYYVRSRGYDGTDYSNGGSDSGWSGWTTITVATVTPSVPAISCPGHSDGSWDDTAPDSPVACTISALGSGPSAPVKIEYGLDQAVTKTVAITPSSDPSVAETTVTVSNSDGGHQVYARAISPAGVWGPGTSVNFGYGKLGMTLPAASPLPLTTDTVRVDATGPPASAGVTPTVSMKWRPAGSGQDDATGWTVDSDPGLEVTSDASGVHVTGAWDTRDATHDNATGTDLNPRVPVLLDVQVCITYGGGATQCSWATTHRQVERVPHAFGNGYPTTDVPDGQVALWTGEFETDATDADLSAGSDDLSISRTASTYAGPPTDPASAVFGPGWTASLDGPDAGDADEQIIDSTRIDGTIDAVGGGGDVMVFAPVSGQARRTGVGLATGAWVPVDEGTQESGIAASVSGSGADTSFKLADLDGTVTTFTVTTAPTATTDAVFTPSSINEPGEPGNTTYAHDGQHRVTRITAPAPAGVSCPDTGTLPAGCRALGIDYASTTTATSGLPGDYTGQVSSISSVIGDGTSGGDTTTVATYKYDESGRLVSVTDPRNSLTTIYSYDGSSDRIASITDPGLKAIHYSYAGSAAKLSTVTRERPVGDPTGGTAILDTMVYDVATHGTGLPDLSAGDIATWGQSDIPTYAAAVFGPDHPVDPASVGSSDWAYADLYYTDAKGYQTNTAEYGAGRWLYTDTEYDDLGSPVRELDEADIANVQDGAASAADVGTLTIYNSEHADASGAVILPADSVVTDTYAPARYVVLTDGTTAWARPHTHTDYDQGAPNGDINPADDQQYALPTKTTVTAADPDSLAGLQTLSVTDTGYAGAVPGGDASAGWDLGLASISTTEMGGSGDITSKTAYDAQGRVVSTSQPKSDGADAGTRESSYYTAGANDQVASCGNKPAWAGLLCQTSYAAAPNAGPDMITSRATGYNDLQEATQTVETSGSVTRTTTNTYRADGRQSGNTVTTIGLGGSAPVPSVTYGYDPATGLQTSVAPSTGATITAGYDSWGRQTSYSPGSGETTTTIYNAADRVAEVTDPQGSTTYTYDGTDAAGNTEHRSLATRLEVSNTADSTPVEFTGAYDAAGDLSQETMPGGITLHQRFDTAGNLTELDYTGDVTTIDDSGNPTTARDQPWIAWSQTHDAVGRIIDQWTPDGASLTGDTTGVAATGYSRHYTYDRAARLTEVIDEEATSTGTITDPGDTSADGAAGLATTTCVVRDYSFDADGNRTTLKITPAAVDGSCQTGTSPTGVTAKNWSYDNADRLTGGYVYDALGRQTTVPQTDTPEAVRGGSPGNLMLGYYDTNAVHIVTQDGSTTTYGIDAAGRRVSQSTGPTGGSVDSTITNHYDDASDNPAWSSTVAAGTTTIQRYGTDLTGGLADIISGNGVVREVIDDPDGNTVSTITLSGSSDATGLDGWETTDEYGNPEDGAAAPGTSPTNASGAVGGNGYAWHGAARRALDGAGLILMGARMYNPVTGAFSSPDPLYRGNTTAYTYPQDPVNYSDIAGQGERPGDGGGDGSVGETGAGESGAAGEGGTGRGDGGENGRSSPSHEVYEEEVAGSRLTIKVGHGGRSDHDFAPETEAHVREAVRKSAKAMMKEFIRSGTNSPGNFADKVIRVGRIRVYFEGYWVTDEHFNVGTYYRRP